LTHVQYYRMVRKVNVNNLRYKVRADHYTNIGRKHYPLLHMFFKADYIGSFITS